MITRIEIDGFKSFKRFEMEFTPLTVIAGANASGKSNLFDALQLLSCLAEMDLRTAFGEQRGDASELFTQYNTGDTDDTMSFAVEMLVNRTVKDNWGGEAELKYTRLRYEITIARKMNDRGLEELFLTHERLVNLKHDEDKWVGDIIDRSRLSNWRPQVGSGRRSAPYIDTVFESGVPSFVIPQDQSQGNKRTLRATEAKQSVLSGITNVDFRHIFAVREEMRSWKFLQFNPEDLRKPTVQGPNVIDTISHSGKNLAAALFRLRQDNEYTMVEISRKLNSFLPEFTEVQVLDDRENKQFILKLKGIDGRVFSSRVLSEGTLHHLVLCVFLYDPQHNSTLCLEDPENGIHPYRIKAMVGLIKELSTDFKDSTAHARQVIVNTHSPAVVNEIAAWDDVKTVSLWFESTNSLIVDFKGMQVKTRITKMLPASNDRQTSIELLPTEENWNELQVWGFENAAHRARSTRSALTELNYL